MKTNERRNNCKRIIAFALILAVGVTFTPMLGSPVYAAATPGSTATVDKSIRTPTNSLSQYVVYSKYFDYSTNSNYDAWNDLYMEYRVKGGAWKTSGRMSSPYQGYKISGLKPNKVYQTRSYFAHWSDGQLVRGPYSKIASFRTGKAKKVAIKSIKVKAVKVKRHKATYYGYYTGLPLGKYKYYTYKVKVTVKLKKKPGAKGIYINGKRLKGNKKKYTVTFGTFSNYSKPRGKKFKVYVYSYQNPKYGGYSPLYSKNKKIK